MLTGKCKTKFESWYVESWWSCKYDSPYCERKGLFKIAFFYELPFSMQYGVYVDFFDRVGINIWCYSHNGMVWNNAILTDGRFMKMSKGVFYSRHEARQKAILKANEIYNTL